MGKGGLPSTGYISAIIEAILLSGISSIIAQVVELYGHNVCSLRPQLADLELVWVADLTQVAAPFDAVGVAQFVVFAALTSGPNFAFQHFMENRRPSRASTGPQAYSKSAKDGRWSLHDSRRKLSVRNTLIKFVLDQSISASVNTLLFNVLLGAIKGRELAYIY